MSDYEVGEPCNLALFEKPKSKDNQRDELLKEFPEEMLNFAEGIMQHWTVGEKLGFQGLPEHLQKGELLRLMRKYKGKK